TTGRGCGPCLRSSRSHSGGSACSEFSSSRVTTPSWNSAGVASRYSPNFFAAVPGFIVWVVLRDVMPRAYRVWPQPGPGPVTWPCDRTGHASPVSTRVRSRSDSRQVGTDLERTFPEPAGPQPGDRGRSRRQGTRPRSRRDPVAVAGRPDGVARDPAVYRDDSGAGP